MRNHQIKQNQVKLNKNLFHRSKRPSSVTSVKRSVRLPSFTMLELITVLTISTIVIGTAYLAYELIYTDFLDYKEKTTDTLATMDFVTILERDITNADSIHINEYEWILHQKNQKINYSFESNQITKTLNNDLTTHFDIETLNTEQWQYLLPQSQTKKVIFE